MDETIGDLSKANFGKQLRFGVVRKEVLHNFEERMAAATAQEKPNFARTIDRVVDTVLNQAHAVPMHPSWQLEPDSDGKVHIHVSRDVRRRLEKLKHPGETDEDVINRVMDVHRRPTYAEGTPEHVFALEMDRLMIAVTLDPSQAPLIKENLMKMSEEDRYHFLFLQMSATIRSESGDISGERLGTLVALAEAVLSPEKAHGLADAAIAERKAVQEKLASGLSQSDIDMLAMDEVAIAAAVKVANTLETLPPDMQAAVITNLMDGNFAITNGDAKDDVMPGFTDRVTAKLSAIPSAREAVQRLLDSDNKNLRFSTEQRTKLEHYLHTGDTKPALRAWPLAPLHEPQGLDQMVLARKPGPWLC